MSLYVVVQNFLMKLLSKRKFGEGDNTLFLTLKLKCSGKMQIWREVSLQSSLGQSITNSQSH